jgi:primosomal protein N' (replication factor Y) (superfamily II helicase)
MNEFAKIVIPGIALDREFDYAVPAELREKISIGSLAEVNFGKDNTQGIVTGLSSRTRIPKIKNILSITAPEPVMSENMLKFTRWIADNYFCSWGEALEACLVPEVKARKTAPETAAEAAMPELPGLLTDEQFKVLEQLKAGLQSPGTPPGLLWGGKTSERIKIYLELAAALIHDKKQLMIVFPKLEMLEPVRVIFEQRFPGQVAVLHSGLNGGEKRQIWEQVRQGKVSIVLGTRIALFYLFRDLGMIIVEEEQDTAYKSDQKPMYHARDAAVKRAELENVPVLLASSAPSAESYYKATSKEYSLHKLGTIFDKETVKIKVLTLGNKSKRDGPVNFTKEFLDAIEQRLERRERSVIFVNMRGYSTYVFCRLCQHVMKCPDCDVPLTMNQEKKKLYCRYCGYSRPHSPECPSCHGQNLIAIGFGAETVTASLQAIFPQAKILKIDSLTPEKQREVDNCDILVGTQILNNYDLFPKATFLGVMLVDLLLNLPDFRAAEHTFQNLIGLIQRLDTAKGCTEVIIQAEKKEHYVLQALLDQDWDGFYKEELAFRKELKYPPYGSLALVEVRGEDQAKTDKAAAELAAKFQGLGSAVKVYGPAPSFKGKLRGQFFRNIILKSASRKTLVNALKKVKPNKRSAGLTISTDVDPVEMM